jgi:hypothetical protein
MAVITSGKTFANGEQLSASKLNQAITAATFNASDAVDGSTMTLVGGAMAVRDTGITTAKIADSNVTKAKIENVANMKVLGNTSGSAAAPQEVAILDEDNMSTDSDTSLATQQSIKAYVDTTAGPTVGFTPTSYTGTESVTLPNGLIMKFGEGTASSGTGTVTYGAAFPNAVISVNISPRDSSTRSSNYPTITASSGSAFSYAVNTNVAEIYWQAIGH